VWREFNAMVLRLSADSPDGLAQHQSMTGQGYEHWLDKTHSSVEVAGFKIVLMRKQPAAMLKEILEQARAEKAGSGRDWEMAALDDDLLPEKLRLRPRRKGETARVCGQRKNIKLKKLMIDHRIACSRREAWPLLVTPDGEYVWSPGLPPALKFTASDKSQTLAIVRASEV
jgi:tRNA(Ile)-lysidine synthetase-like protein